MHQFKQPDINAPRFRPKAKHIVDKHFIERFREKYPQHATLTKEEILTIVRAFNTKIQEEVLNNRLGVELPHRLGYIFIGSCKPDTSANFNFKVSGQHNRPLRYTNLDTDGYIAKIFYCNYKERYKFPLRELWAFTASKTFRKHTSRVYVAQYERYMTITPRTQIASAFTKERIEQREYMQKKAQENLKTYNEFDI